MNWIGLLASSYLLGAIPFGLLLGRWLGGTDVRAHGSGNIGSTNVWRVCGARLGALAFACDIAKGFVPVFWAAEALVPQAPVVARVLAAAAAVLGHTFPVYLWFRGGKGVATSAGALLALMPAATGVAAAVFALVLALGRYVSVASTAAAVAIVAAQHLLEAHPYRTALPVTCLAWAVFALVVVRHRGNYRRLWAGTENRLGAAKAASGHGTAAEQRHPTDEGSAPGPVQRGEGAFEEG